MSGSLATSWLHSVASWCQDEGHGVEGEEVAIFRHS